MDNCFAYVHVSLLNLELYCFGSLNITVNTSLVFPKIFTRKFIFLCNTKQTTDHLQTDDLNEPLQYSTVCVCVSFRGGGGLHSWTELSSILTQTSSYRVSLLLQSVLSDQGKNNFFSHEFFGDYWKMTSHKFCLFLTTSPTPLCHALCFMYFNIELV